MIEVKSVFLTVKEKYGNEKKKKNFPEAMWQNFYANVISLSLNINE